jgi:hypothetical protein
LALEFDELLRDLQKRLFAVVAFYLLDHQICGQAPPLSAYVSKRGWVPIYGHINTNALKQAVCDAHACL